MYGFKLVITKERAFYYDDNELETAIYDQSLYGGVIYDRYGSKVY